MQQPITHTESSFRLLRDGLRTKTSCAVAGPATQRHRDRQNATFVMQSDLMLGLFRAGTTYVQGNEKTIACHSKLLTSCPSTRLVLTRANRLHTHFHTMPCSSPSFGADKGASTTKFMKTYSVELVEWVKSLDRQDDDDTLPTCFADKNRTCDRQQALSLLWLKQRAPQR